MHGTQEIRIAPRTDAGLDVRRDVGRVDRAEVRLERSAAREQFAALLRVAGLAVRGDGEIAALRQRIRALEVRRYAGGLAAVISEGDTLAVGEGHRARLPDAPRQQQPGDDQDAEDDANPL